MEERLFVSVFRIVKFKVVFVEDEISEVMYRRE